MGGKLRIHGSVFLLAALWVLVLPPAWTAGTVLAVSVHEFFHLLAVLLCGGQIYAFEIHPGGVCMETTPLSPGMEALCALAGPAGSFLMLTMSETFPEAALCGLLQGAYNLLPIYPLDGGRICRSLLPRDICLALEMFVLTFLTGFCLWLTAKQRDMGLILLFFLWIPVFRRKSSCKEPLLAVQ